MRCVELVLIIVIPLFIDMEISENLENLYQQLIPSDMKSLDVVTLARFEFIQRYMGRDTLIDDRSTFMKQYIAYENEDV